MISICSASKAIETTWTLFLSASSPKVSPFPTHPSEKKEYPQQPATRSPKSSGHVSRQTGYDPSTQRCSNVMKDSANPKKEDSPVQSYLFMREKNHLFHKNTHNFLITPDLHLFHLFFTIISQQLPLLIFTYISDLIIYHYEQSDNRNGQRISLRLRT